MNVPCETLSDEEEQKVYIKVGLAKYPFLKDAKINSSGEIKFKGEISSSSKHPETDEVGHEVTFNDFMPKKDKVRI